MSRRSALGLFAGVALAAHAPRSFVSSPAPVPVAAGLEIMPREAWAGGREPTGPLAPESDVRFLLVHHTASGNGDDPIGVMRVAYDFHTGPEKGWPDVAYNFFIDQFGVVWEARKGSLAGPVEASATGGSQGFAQLVCLLGNFTSQLPTGAALASLNRTLAWLAVRSNIDTAPGTTTQFVSRGSNRWPAGTSVTAATISGHRDMSQTACPGDTFYPYLVAEVPGQVTDLTAGSAPPPSLAPATSAPPTTSAQPTTSLPQDLPATSVDLPASTSEPTSPTVTPTTAGPTPAIVSSESSASPPAASGGSSESSGNDIGTPALVALGGGALAGAAFLARRHQRAEQSEQGADDSHGASS